MEEEGEEKAKDDDDLHVQYGSYHIIRGVSLVAFRLARDSMEGEEEEEEEKKKAT